MRNDMESSVLRTIAYGKEHDAFDSPWGQSLLRAWELGASDEELVRMIEDIVRPYQKRAALGELIPFKLPRLFSGSLAVGADMRGNAVCLVAQRLNSGQLMLGNTGAAKSNSVKVTILGLAPSLDGLWCTDMYKTELRHLRPLLGKLNRDFVVARSHRIKINVLQPDSNDIRGHLEMTLGILKRVLGLPPRAMTILRMTCYQLYRDFGNLDGRTDAWPTLFDAFERIRTAPGLNLAAKEALLDRLGAFLLSVTPEVAAYRMAWRPSDLTRHFIDFEFNAASEQVKSILLNYCLFSVLHHRVAQRKPNATMDFWAVFEDAQRFFSAHGEDTGDIAPAEELAGLIRGTGAGIAFTAQTLSGLPKGLLANLATKCMFRLGSHTDYQALGADMGMTSEQIEWAKLNLRPGLSIWSLAEGPHRLPFIVRTPKVEVPPVVDDAEADRSMAALERLPSVPATEFARWQPDDYVELQPTVSPVTPKLIAAELRFLKAVADQPGQASAVYSKLSGMNGKRAAEIRSRLVQDGYLRQHEVATGERGRNALILEPLDAAFEALALHPIGEES